jgi:hypothetical protein
VSLEFADTLPIGIQQESTVVCGSSLLAPVGPVGLGLHTNEGGPDDRDARICAFEVITNDRRLDLT